jgi:16S rRNA (uracil1498-N3)-methyltransferase
MNRFFTNGEIVGNRLEITGGDAHHIKNVLRLREGEKIICVKNKKEFVCNIDKFEKNSIIVLVENIKNTAKKENVFQLTLMQGLPKGDKFDFIIEKAVETGVNTIIPLKLDRCIAKINAPEKKLSRYNKIAKSAAEQSSRLVIPVVSEPKSINEIDFAEYDLKILCYEDEDRFILKSALQGHRAPQNIAVIIGPEGGISTGEAQYLKENGFISVSLGGRILRCETAGLYTVACINYHYTV